MGSLFFKDSKSYRQARKRRREQLNQTIFAFIMLSAQLSQKENPRELLEVSSLSFCLRCSYTNILHRFV